MESVCFLWERLKRARLDLNSLITDPSAEGFLRAGSSVPTYEEVRVQRPVPGAKSLLYLRNEAWVMRSAFFTGGTGITVPASKEHRCLHFNSHTYEQESIGLARTIG